MQRYHICCSLRRQKFVKKFRNARQEKGTGEVPPSWCCSVKSQASPASYGRLKSDANFIARPMSPLIFSFPLMKAAVGSSWPMAIFT
jgi:hypothetical protein